jgi:hypothetical protein
MTIKVDLVTCRTADTQPGALRKCPLSVFSLSSFEQRVNQPTSMYNAYSEPLALVRHHLAPDSLHGVGEKLGYSPPPPQRITCQPYL